jgi:DNA replication protein DnaC
LFPDDGTLASERPLCVSLVCFLDELDYLPIDKRGADLLFLVVAARYEVGSIVISTNRSLPGMGQTL